MPLPEEDRRALLTRLAPAGGAAADVVAEAVDDGEELREILVDAQGDVVAFTDRRALFVADGAADAVAVPYDEVEVRKRDAGLAIDALIEGGRLVLDVARGTFARLAVVGAGGPPGRASWLPLRTPPPRPEPEPVPPPMPAWSAAPAPGPAAAPAPAPVPAPPAQAGDVPVSPSSVPPPPPPAPTPAGATALASMPPPMPRPTGLPPAGWHPDPSRRHWWRWWDGIDWTDHVADGGPPSIDPLPPR
jgi:hypothetical protein